VLHWEANSAELLDQFSAYVCYVHFKVHITIFVHFERSGRQFLWSDKEDKIQGKCVASWEMICRPMEQGGLGVLDLST
jgi:hypothetical protein